MTEKTVNEQAETMGEYLLAHLDYEERSITPTVRTWTAWPA
jgi:hypothetical protein